jgi:hypothetical protein
VLHLVLVQSFLDGVGALFSLSVKLLLKLQEVLMDVLQSMLGINSIVLQTVLLMVDLCPMGDHMLELLVLFDRILNLPMNVVNLLRVEVHIVKEL